MVKSFSTSPHPSVIQQLIQLLNQGHLVMAEQKAKALIAQHPREFIMHHVLSLALDQQQKYTEAAASYQAALALQPNMPDLLISLAIESTH